MQEENFVPFDYEKRTRHIVRYITGFVISLVGIADMLSAFLPKIDDLLSVNTLVGSLLQPLLSPWPVVGHRAPAQTFIVVIGFFLLVLSYGLMRGKHHAWRITLILLLLSALLHVQRSGSIAATFIALILVLFLYTLRRFFKAKSDPPSARRGYVALGLGLGIVTFYTIGGFLFLYNDFEPLIERIGIERTLLGFFYHTPFHLLHGTPAFFFQNALPVLCISAILYGMGKIFRPVAQVFIPPIEERSRASQITHLYGKNSICYFALGEDKNYFFSASKQCVISYVLQGSTAVVAGDPIGPDNEMKSVIRQFINFCNEQDWTVVFWQVREEIAALYRSAGFHLLKIGEDAVLNPQEFTLKGGAMANVRSSARRAEKEEIQILFYRGHITDCSYLEQMTVISFHWLQEKGGGEMGFSMGHFDPSGDPELLYALAVDAMNHVHAFVSFVPVYGRNGWGLDLMRRADACAPGTMELLLARSIDYMKNTGFEMVSLGLAPLSNVNEEEETFIGTSVDFLTEHFGNPNKNQSLFHFKKKFQPTWESRYLVYSDALNLPKTGWALYMAHQPDVSLIGTLRMTLKERLRTRQELRNSGGKHVKTVQAN